MFMTHTIYPIILHAVGWKPIFYLLLHMCFLKIISTTVHPFATTFKVFLTGSSFISCFRVVHDSYEEFIWSNGPIAIYWCLKNLLVVSRRVLHSSLLCITQQIVVTFCESFKLRAPHALKGCGGGGQSSIAFWGVREAEKNPVCLNTVVGIVLPFKNF